MMSLVMSRCCFSIVGDVLYVSRRSRLCGVLCECCVGLVSVMLCRCLGNVAATSL